MRLLYYSNTGAIRLTRDIVEDIPPYAILSHTWDTEEVTLQELNDGTGLSKRGYLKIRFCGKQARRDGLSHFWVDTCCIDKNNAAELQEAINSMSCWYRNAARCYVYLVDVSCPTSQSTEAQDGPPQKKRKFLDTVLSPVAEPTQTPWEAGFRKSRYFTRGWTLQELLAPASVEFFSEEGTLLGNKSSLEQSIADVTRIPVQALRNNRLSDFSTEDRFSWMESRKTTIEEDMVYALLGIFDVHMPVFYGEGRLKAYGRLQKEIKKHQNCLQLFRLTSSSRDATYEWYKDRVQERVEDTCLWFLQHPNFQRWLEQKSGPLFVSADPGCGKSVLAKYLIDHHLPRSATICYFFFKDNDQDTARQALCALLHQLFSQKPALIKHARLQFDINGAGLIDSNNLLWDVLRNSLQDPQAGPIIIVLDALDECAESEFEGLVRNVQSQVSGTQRGNVKYLLTSRPYEQILSQFNSLLASFPYIRIPGEEMPEIISQEVNRVIEHRVATLAAEKELSDEVMTYLEDKLLEVRHRTYLWAYLIFDYLRKTNFRKTPRGVKTMFMTLPRSVNEAYERILSKSEDPHMVRKVMCIILAATRPLTVSEMNVAVNLEEDSRSIHDLDLEKEEDFKLRLRSCCGLFISVHHGKIYFLHQTAREFLLANVPSPASIPSELPWHHSITPHHAHAVLAEICMIYLNFFNSDMTRLDSYAILEFLNYSGKNWGRHFCEARISSGTTTELRALKTCDPDSKAYSAWSQICWEARGQTPLSMASEQGNEAVVRLLLENGADLELKDRHGSTPLSWAVIEGREGVVRLLLEKGANLELKDGDGWTPLSQAAVEGNEAVVRLLLEHGADLESRDGDGSTPLSQAAAQGHEAVVRLLLEHGADLELGYSDVSALLSRVAARGDGAGVQLLLGDDALMLQKIRHETPLWWALREGHAGIVRLLVERAADIKSKNSSEYITLT